MLKGFLGNNGTREHGPSIQVLADDRQKIEKAFESATRNGWKEVIQLSDDTLVVSDTKHTGREIKPLV